MSYVRGEQKAVDGCVFCKKSDAESDETEHVIARSAHVYVTLNRYPYNNGHLMIVPYDHQVACEKAGYMNNRGV